MRLLFLVLLISRSAQLPCLSALLVPSSMQDSTVKESPQWGWGEREQAKASGGHDLKGHGKEGSKY